MISILSLLNSISVFLSLVFQILLVKVFGIYLETDIYYLLIGIIQFFYNVFLGFLMELYIPIYNEIKIKNKNEAQKFVSSLFIFVFLLSFFIALLIFLFPSQIIKIFAAGFVHQKVMSFNFFLKILSSYVIFNSLNFVLLSTLEGNFYLFFPFLIRIFPPLFNIIALFLFSPIYGIKAIFFATLFSSFFIFILLLFYSFKNLSFSFLLSLSQIPNIFYLFKHSLPVRLGGTLWELKFPITMNILSYLPTGSITLFTYAQRIMDILFEIIVSPFFKILYIKFSIFLPQNNIKKIKEIFISVFRSSMFLFITCITFVLIIFEKFFSFIFSEKVSSYQIKTMYYIFLILFLYTILIIFEKPFVYLTICMKKGLKTIQIGVIFIIFYALFLILTSNHFGIYAIPISFILAQIYNSFSYFYYINKKLKFFDGETWKEVLRFIPFFIMIFIFNIIKSSILFKIVINFSILIFLILSLGKENIMSVYRFLFQKGEIK